MKILKLTVHKRYFEAKKENRNVIAGGDVINNHTGQNYTIKRFDAVEFKNGSWKGGTLGCGYTLRKNETPLECLKRMEVERNF